MKIASPTDLIYFVEVANKLNLSRASERLGISQPSLSAAIKRLERVIGIELLIRSKNGVILTPAGKRLFCHAKQLLQLWNTVKAESLASHHEMQGSVTLGCHPSVALYSLAEFLPNLLMQYPKLEIHLKHGLSRKILEEIINLSIDIGIIVNPIRHPDLIIHQLYQDRLKFWYAKDLSNLKNYLYSGNAIIICDPSLVQTQWLLKHFYKNGMKYCRLITSSSLEVIANLTAKNAGLGILPESVACSNSYALEALSNVPAYNDEICLVYRHENRNILAIRTILQSIKTYFKNKQMNGIA